jgi:hypothetical protein
VLRAVVGVNLLPHERGHVHCAFGNDIGAEEGIKSGYGRPAGGHVVGGDEVMGFSSTEGGFQSQERTPLAGAEPPEHLLQKGLQPPGGVRVLEEQLRIRVDTRRLATDHVPEFGRKKILLQPPLQNFLSRDTRLVNRLHNAHSSRHAAR